MAAPPPLGPRAAATLGFTLVAAAGGTAEANHTTLDLVVSPGLTVSLAFQQPGIVWGFGVECSVLSPVGEIGFAGGVAQAQVFTDGTFRFALSGQGGTFVGLELGLAARTGNATRGFALALHAAPYLSGGYAYVSYDLNVNLASPLTVRRLEHMMHTGAKLPFGRYYRFGPSGMTEDSYLDFYQFSLGSGRPLRHDGAPCLADVEGAAAEGPVAAAWARDARLEHASVATFARLSLQLMAVGAPLALVRRAHEAALDEIDHAQRCLALARGDGPMAFTALPEAALAVGRVELAALAVESLTEGCYGEGVAAALAREAIPLASGAARGALERIADDEARHADLAWDVLAWALDAGGAPVREAVDRCLRALAPPSAPRGGGWRPHGLVDAARARAITRRVRRRVVRRARLPRGEDRGALACA